MSGSFAASKKNMSGNTNLAASKKHGKESIAGCARTMKDAHSNPCGIRALGNIVRNKTYRWLDFRGALQT